MQLETNYAGSGKDNPAPEGRDVIRRSEEEIENDLLERKWKEELIQRAKHSFLSRNPTGRAPIFRKK